MNDLLTSTLGTVGAAGEIIDKATGGRALRGTLGGKPRELLSVLPFSDTLGITNPHDVTSGRDLTDAYGLTRKGDDSFGAHAAGFLADNVLSPGNLIGGYGAFKAAPTLAKGITQGAKALTGLDLLDHVGSGARKVGSFLGGESGSLKLPFDGLDSPPKGMLRSDPEWVNNRTFYHGTSTSGLKGDSLDPMQAAVDSLYGRGIYTTDSPQIAGSYATGSLGRGRSGEPSVYQSQSDFKRILDLDQPATPEFRDLVRQLRDSYDPKLVELLSQKGMKAERGNLDRLRLGTDGVLNDKILGIESLTPGAAIKRLQGIHQTTGPANNLAGINSKLAKAGLSFPDRTVDLLEALKGGGFDALTHTGGEVLGGPKHQAVIGLDPNGMLGGGTKAPYKIWEAVKGFGTDESGYLRHAIPGVDKELAQAMDGLGPQHPGGVEKLRRLADQANSSETDGDAYRRLLSIVSDEAHGERVASEIPDGSRFLGAGMEGIAMRTPDGSVVRIGDFPDQANRPDIPEMLQAFRETRVGPYKVEHMPLVDPVYEVFNKPLKEANRILFDGGLTPESRLASQAGLDAIFANNSLNDGFEDVARGLRASITRAGLNPWDASVWNSGITPEGKAIVFDGGAVKGHNASILPKPTFDAPEGDLLQRVLEAGGPEKVRESLRRGIAAGTAGQGIDVPGLADVIQKRGFIQDFLRSQGIEAGTNVRQDFSPTAYPEAVHAAEFGSVPSLTTLLGALGASAGVGGSLAYLSNRWGE